MVTKTAVASPPPEDENYFEYLEASFAERPSRRRAKRTYRRAGRIHVRSQRLPAPDPGRMSKALIQAQRLLVQAQAEADAHRQTQRENGDGPS
jgi:hypothetical protein